MSLIASVQLTRRRLLEGRYEKGQWVPGSLMEDLPFKGTWQAASGRALELLPEGKRAGEVYKAFVPRGIDIITSDPVTGRQADKIVWMGKEYEVSHVADWNNGLIPHWEVLCTREKEGAA